jgi:predicted GIY-YIG superfamily endonuclease
VSAAQRSWYLYLARCSDGTLYTGIAVDVPARIAAHDAGRGARYTRGRGPLALCAVRRCTSKGAALRLEHAVKRLTRAEKERLLVGRRLSAFARRCAAGSPNLRAGRSARSRLA